MREFSFELFTKRGSNIMDPNNGTFQHYKKKLGRDPVLSDFDVWHISQYNEYLAYAQLIGVITSGQPLYVMFGSGARRDSIARIVTRPKIERSQYDSIPRLATDAEITVEWAGGKTWSFSAGRNAFYGKKGEFHSILADYDGDPVYNFEKKARVVQPTPELKDNYVG